MAQTNILLETGTNEFEIVEFYVGSQSYGVNVAKVREIIQYNQRFVTPVPENHPAVIGLYTLRGETFPLINLSSTLKTQSDESSTRRVIMVCEFNTLVNGFLVDGVRQIHRRSWEDVKPVGGLVAQGKSTITSTVQIDDLQMLILDLESIIADIYPPSSMTPEENVHSHMVEKREGVKLVFAEDSSIIRDAVTNILKKAGYIHTTAVKDGKEAYDLIVDMKARADRNRTTIKEYLTGVVTDIEMPRMDGLTLCKKVKVEMGLSIPVIVFSSMINEQMAVKCREVGADAFTTKPRSTELVELIDRHFLPAGA
ncbi:MAG: chemotaxis protein CheV [Nitrospinae bacterium]|nr:chemotaxis protein CheV [Nitrospinota bacterium]MBF0634286.1 chemotaxis protein CheV [Nitrospinota bacterium]